jgi:hypothetical protein
MGEVLSARSQHGVEQSEIQHAEESGRLVSLPDAVPAASIHSAQAAHWMVRRWHSNPSTSSVALHSVGTAEAPLEDECTLTHWMSHSGQPTPSSSSSRRRRTSPHPHAPFAAAYVQSSRGSAVGIHAYVASRRSIAAELSRAADPLKLPRKTEKTTGHSDNHDTGIMDMRVCKVNSAGMPWPVSLSYRRINSPKLDCQSFMLLNSARSHRDELFDPRHQRYGTATVYAWGG